jgi:5S rRNA maturation endonuclease (ribonuclease M5)
MKIREFEVDVDYRKELEQYEWKDPKWTEDRLIACSPFRDEDHPSFAVNLENGLWIDSGGDGDQYKGNFVSITAFLRNESYTESEEYLLEEYFQLYFRDTDDLSLDFGGWVKPKYEYPILDKSILSGYAYRHPYLEGRGIEDKYQRAVHIGYDRKHRAISIPWFDKNQNLVTIKFRSVNDKRFWYYGEGQKVRDHLWGLWLVYIKQSKRVFVVESEIDALTLWAAGFPAIAVGGSSLTPKQRKLIIDSPIESLVLATDNDKVGKRLARSIVQKMNGLVSIEEMKFPYKYKDVNDIPREELLMYAEQTYDRTFEF